MLLILGFSFELMSQQSVFSNTYGQSVYNHGIKVIENDRKEYFILANESADAGSSNIHIIKTDSNGIILSEQIYGNQYLYWANDFIQTSDKGFLICGFTNNQPLNGYDLLLIKTDSNAVKQWEKTYGGFDWDIGKALLRTLEDTYIVCGETYSYGPPNNNIFIIKTTLSGDTIWTRVIGNDSTEYASSLCLWYDGSVLIGGTTNSFGAGSYDGYVINLDLNGDTVWTKTFGEEHEDIINSIQSTPDSGFVFVGSTKSYNAIEREFWLMKYDKNKNLIWKMPESWNIGWADDVANSVSIDDSARYVITGFTTGAGAGAKELSLLIMEENNNFHCSLTSGTPDDETGKYVIQTKDKGYVIIGNSEGFGIASSNIFLLKINGTCSFDPIPEHILEVHETNFIEQQSSISINENISANGTYEVHFKLLNGQERFYVVITDVIGRMVLSENIVVYTGSKHVLNLRNQPQGLYLVNIFNRNTDFKGKIIKLSE